MEFKYRVIGKVNNSFILRGLHLAVGQNIDLIISESEFEFVKAHCQCKNIIHLGEKANHSILQLTDKDKGEETNEQLSKPVRKRTKNKDNTNL